MKAPPCVELSLRRKGRKLLIHLTNTAGMQAAERYAVVDFVPPVGPVELTVRLPKGVTGMAKPKARLVGERAQVRPSKERPDRRGRLTARAQGGALRVALDGLDIHAVVEIG